MIRVMRTPLEHTNYGRDLVWTENLAFLRGRLGFTRSAMADLLHMSPLTYNKCEDDPESGRRIWASTAERLGRFAYLAELTLAELEEEGVELADLSPLHMVAMTQGIPQEVMLRWYRNGIIRGVDLGVLGLWIHKDDLHILREAACG